MILCGTKTHFLTCLFSIFDLFYTCHFLQLIVGNYGLSLEQAKSQMAVWAILAAPLIMSHDLRNVRPEFREILLNREIIAVNQDKRGIQGRRVYDVSAWYTTYT